jgi:hypothetical protein
LWFLYADESGDLGFDFKNKHPSNYFTITVLALRTHANHRSMINAVKKTIDRKLTPRRKRKRTPKELKGSGTTLDVKKYFFRQVSGIRFAIYSMTLNKRRLYPDLQARKEITYNFLARLVLEEIPFEQAGIRVSLTFDRRKSAKEVKKFNRYLEMQLRDRLSPIVPLDIHHESSQEALGLQAVDMFSYGIFRKYEMGDSAWYDVFRGKVIKDDIYLK